MNIQSIQNKVERRSKFHQSKHEYKDIGTFIKKRRKELNITQDAVCSGICSISYLSKIENNQISPNEFFIKEIMHKLQVDDDITNTFLHDEQYLHSLIEAYFYNDEETFSVAYKEISAIQNGTVHYLGEFIYSLYTHSNNAYILLNRLENMIMNMNDFELKTYLLFSGIYHINNLNFKPALEVLLLIEEIHYKDDFLDALYHNYLYITKQRLHIRNTSEKDYQIAQNIFNKYINHYRYNHLLLNRINNIKNEHIKYAETLLQSMNPNNLKDLECDFNILYANVLIELDKHQEAIIRLNHIQEQSTCYYEKLVLLYKICCKEDDIEMGLEIESLINLVEQSKSNQQYRIMFHTLKIKEDEKKKEYIRDIAIPFSIKSSDLTHLKYYVDLIIKICIDTSRYKEATQYYQKYHKEMNRISNLLK